MKNIIKLAFVICIIVTIIYYSSQRRDNLRTNGIWGKGRIIGTKIVKGTYFVYLFNGKIYNRTCPFTDIEIKLLLNRTLPVLYIKDDENINSLFIRKGDFEKYEIPYPDSLKWMCDSLNICE
jgi:hypothetical protein